MLLTVFNILLRRPDPAAPVSATELALSAVVTLIFLVTGWLGGEMVFRHRVGVTPAAPEPPPMRGDVVPTRLRAARR